MAARAPLGRFQRGLVTSFAPDERPADSLIVAENVAYRPELFSLRGAPAAVEFATFPSRVISLGVYATDGGSSFLMAHCVGGIYAVPLSGGEPTLVASGITPTERSSFVTYLNTCCFFNGVDTPKKIGEGLQVSDLTTDSVQGSIAVLSNDKVFVSGDPKAPSMLYFSATGEISDWHTAGNAGSIFVGRNDGDRIVALAPYQHRLYIIKERSIWVLTGRAPDEFMLERVSSSVGCAAHASVSVTDSGITMMSWDGVVEFGDSINPIDEYVRATVTPAHAPFSSAGELVSSKQSQYEGADAIVLYWRADNASSLSGFSFSCRAWSNASPYGVRAYVRRMVSTESGSDAQWVLAAENTAGPGSSDTEKEVSFSITEQASRLIGPDGFVAVMIAAKGGSVQYSSESSSISGFVYPVTGAFTHGARYAVGVRGSTYCYDHRASAWSTATYPLPRASASAGGRTFFSSGAVVYEVGEEPMPYRIDTGELGIGGFDNEKIFRSCIVTTSGEGVARVSVSVDGSVVSTGSFYVSSRPPQVNDIGIFTRGSTVSVAFSADGSVSLLGLDIMYVPVKERR